jgi:hypothetical protein
MNIPQWMPTVFIVLGVFYLGYITTFLKDILAAQKEIIELLSTIRRQGKKPDEY